MLIGCITGPDFETAKRQIEKANRLCDGIELREDLLQCDAHLLSSFAKGRVILTQNGVMRTKGLTISSYHNFEETPEDLEDLLASLPKGDLYKIATMGHSTLDTLRLLNFAQERPNVIAICMGPFGEMTRILAPKFGAGWNFAAVGKPAAPGQLQVEELLETYHYRELNQETALYGLIGSPVSQSPSHMTHNAYFRKKGINAVYLKMEVKEEELPLFFPLIKKLGFKGLSVTIPLKEKLSPFIDEIDDEARAIGAVNTLTFSDKVYGSNTDAKGGIEALGLSSLTGKRCLILGEGGSAKALAYEAKKRGAIIAFHSRKRNNLTKLPPYDILINTIPHPTPIDPEELQQNTHFMDISLSHANSPLMEKAKELNCTVTSGEKMFELQAQGQFAKWELDCKGLKK